MREFLEFVFKTLTDPERLIAFLATVMTGWYGYAILFGVVFAETGLLMGFFLPGDSFLFTIGVVAGAGQLDIVAINLLLMFAAIVGDATGYYLGRRTGPVIFARPDSKLFRKEHLIKTQEFYNKHGGKTIIYARFVPIIRTFAPFVAGVAGMPYRKFAMFNVVGGIAWVFSMTMAGYFLGNVPLVRRHFEKVVILIVLVSFIPILIEYLKSRASKAELARP